MYQACNSKMVFKICEGISCSSFYVKEFEVTFYKKKKKKVYPLYNPIKFFVHFCPFCTPNHQRTWWMRWELGIDTRSYCMYLTQDLADLIRKIPFYLCKKCGYRLSIVIPIIIINWSHHRFMFVKELPMPHKMVFILKCGPVPHCRSHGYEDELGWGALWLHKATGEKAYLNKALEFRPSRHEGLFSWDDKRAGYLVRELIS